MKELRDELIEEKRSLEVALATAYENLDNAIYSLNNAVESRWDAVYRAQATYNQRIEEIRKFIQKVIDEHETYCESLVNIDAKCACLSFLGDWQDVFDTYYESELSCPSELEILVLFESAFEDLPEGMQW